MGMAIIGVVMFHFRLQAPILSVISNYGYTGVDFFMFLSAFGLYYSMSKNDNVMMFSAYIPHVFHHRFFMYLLFISEECQHHRIPVGIFDFGLFYGW